MLEGHFCIFAAIAAKAEFLVTNIVTGVLIRFPIITQHSKGVHYFHRVVGLVVINIHQWAHIESIYTVVMMAQHLRSWLGVLIAAAVVKQFCWSTTRQQCSWWGSWSLDITRHSAENLQSSRCDWQLRSGRASHHKCIFTIIAPCCHFLTNCSIYLTCLTDISLFVDSSFKTVTVVDFCLLVILGYNVLVNKNQL